MPNPGNRMAKRPNHYHDTMPNPGNRMAKRPNHYH